MPRCARVKSFESIYHIMVTVGSIAQAHVSCQQEVLWYLKNNKAQIALLYVD
ncbi:hypothetical protein [Oxobacter pfennigii]|uniref:hypothetical protein n=1 Tax=Oxobacter pfennigii TaxID=36849 RepID=UPI001364C7A9|nr:hypothetical protein [Oxobacter pfennigii]